MKKLATTSLLTCTVLGSLALAVPFKANAMATHTNLSSSPQESTFPKISTSTSSLPSFHQQQLIADFACATEDHGYYYVICCADSDGNLVCRTYYN